MPSLKVGEGRSNGSSVTLRDNVRVGIGGGWRGLAGALACGLWDSATALDVKERGVEDIRCSAPAWLLPAPASPTCGNPSSRQSRPVRPGSKATVTSAKPAATSPGQPDLTSPSRPMTRPSPSLSFVDTPRRRVLGPCITERLNRGAPPANDAGSSPACYVRKWKPGVSSRCLGSPAHKTTKVKNLPTAAQAGKGGRMMRGAVRSRSDLSR